MTMKNPVTPVGNEPATFRVVAQHCATAVPLVIIIIIIIIIIILDFTEQVTLEAQYLS